MLLLCPTVENFLLNVKSSVEKQTLFLRGSHPCIFDDIFDDFVKAGVRRELLFDFGN